MRFELLPEKEITDYEKELGVELVVKERNLYGLPKYYVAFENTEVSEGITLRGTTGNGMTMDEALIDYAKEISNRRLVIHAYDKSMRRETTAPKLIHTKLLNK